eukprot:TRINITY_DN18454_c0_g1_i1.p1 TRINITY_DN18454_c0_g1~~TRINITY_DN18454_c0_g1_i1.p1  ORF type:complete len:246 (+),score=59.51 TRINITY_DN18454_c0_g1_i1:94-831(+)
MDVSVRVTAGGLQVGDQEVPLYTEQVAELLGVVDPVSRAEAMCAGVSQGLVFVNSGVCWGFTVWAFAAGRWDVGLFGLCVLAATDASVVALTDHEQAYSLTRLYARPQKRMRMASALLPIIEALNFWDLFRQPATSAHAWCAVLRLRHIAAIAFYKYIAYFPYLFLQALLPTGGRPVLAALHLSGIAATLLLLLLLRCCTRNRDAYWLDGFGLYPWNNASQPLVLLGSYFVVATLVAVSFYVSDK